MVARLSADGSEIAADKNFAVRLSRDCIDIPVRVRIERVSRAGYRIKSGDVVAWLTADVGETAADQNIAVRLHHD